MENNNKQPEKKESSVQWHTLSENLMDLSTENKEPRREAHDSPFHQGRIQPRNENNTTSPPSPTPRPEPVEIQEMPSGPKKKPVWGIVAVAAVLVLAIGAGLFYFTVHRWTEPTCTEASVCKICGKTGSPAAGHSWTPASCTAPKTCSVCHETKGSPLEHDLTDEVSYDFIKCKKETWKACSRCEYRTSSKSEQLTSFLDEKGEYFLMSPNAFKERLEYFLKNCTLSKEQYYDFSNLSHLTVQWGVWDASKTSEDFTNTKMPPLIEIYYDSDLLAYLELRDFIESKADENDRDMVPSFTSVFSTYVYDDYVRKTDETRLYFELKIALVAICDPKMDLYRMVPVGLASTQTSEERNGLVYRSQGRIFGISADNSLK